MSVRTKVTRTLAAAVAIAAAGVAALLAYAFAPTLFGAEALIVTSGSMGDAAPIGSVAVTRLVDSRAVAVGDVITFRPPGARSSVTHRVIEARSESGRRVFITKGDANPAADPEPVYVEERVHRVERVVPFAGRVVAAARTPAGGIALVLVPILGLMADRRRSSRSAAPSAPREDAPAAAPASMSSNAEPIAAIVGGLVVGAIAFGLAGRSARKHPRLSG